VYHRSVRILIVDHDNQTQHSFANTLECLGLTVKTVGTVLEAREAIATDKYYLVVMELFLSDESGMNLIRDLAASDNHKPKIIIVTGQPSLSTVTESMQLGARNYLTKPIATAELVEAVKTILAEDGLIIHSDKHLISTLGHRLRIARQTNDMTMKQLSQRVGISQAQISLIEAGQSAPSLNTLFRLARALNVNIPDLFKNYQSGL
jgi:DNA-binding response OmpR family regulator